MDAKYLAEIKARADAATPGPWEYSECASEIWSESGDTVISGVDWGGCAISASDADFIAQARTDIPALVAEVERLNRELSRIRSNASDDKKMRRKDITDKDQQIATLKKALELACEHIDCWGSTSAELLYFDFVRQAQEQESAT